MGTSGCWGFWPRHHHRHTTWGEVNYAAVCPERGEERTTFRAVCQEQAFIRHCSQFKIFSKMFFIILRFNKANDTAVNTCFSDSHSQRRALCSL